MTFERLLCISDSFGLPLDAVTETFGVLGVRGSGKSYAASVMAEEMLKAQLRIVVIDPLGAWFGLRTSASGQAAGLPIVVLGGEHADLPITSESGERAGRLVVEHDTSVILDLGLFSKGQQSRFVTDFAETLYRLNRTPRHIFMDEADRYIPQQPLPGEQRMLGAMDDLVRRGRMRGLGMTLITQRSAHINKSVFEQVEVLIAMRTKGVRDRKAIKDWIESNGSREQSDILLDSLPALETGTAWIVSAYWLNVFERIQIRKRSTFDSSATPKLGQARALPISFAPVDVEALRLFLQEDGDAPIDTGDIAALKARIRLLEAREPEVVEKSILTDDDRSLMQRVQELLQRVLPQQIQEPRRLEITEQAVAVLPSIVYPAADTAPSMPVIMDEGKVDLNKAEQTLLRTLFDFYPDFLSRRETAVRSGYRPASGSISAAYAALKTKGLIEDDRQRGIRISRAGLGYFAGVDPTPQSPDALRRRWLQNLNKAEANLLSVLIEAYPDRLDKLEIASRAGYSMNSGSFSAALATLRRHRLVDHSNDGDRAADSLF